MKSSYLYRTSLFCPLQVTPSLWLPTVPDATALWKNILELSNLFSKNVHLLYLLLPYANLERFFFLQKSLTTLMEQSVL